MSSAEQPRPSRLVADHRRGNSTSSQVAKRLDQSKKYLLRAVDCYKENHSIFQV